MKYAYVALVALGLLVGERSDAVGVGVVRSYGVKLGVVSAGQSWDYSGGMSGLKVFDKRRSGLAVGGYVEWLAIPTISLVTEVDYAQKGCRDAVNVLSEGSPVPTGTMTIRPRLDYVSIPVLLKLRYGLSFGSVYGWLVLDMTSWSERGVTVEWLRYLIMSNLRIMESRWGLVSNWQAC